MAIIKRQEDFVDEAPNPTYTVSLPPSFAPLPSKTVPAENEATNTFTIPSFAPISRMTDTPTPTPNANAPQLPSFAPLESREPVSISTPVWPTTTPTSLPLDIQEKHGQGLSGGVIAGIVVGAVVGSCLFIYMAYVLCWSRRNIKKKKSKKSSRNPSDGAEVEDEKPNREILTKNNKNSNYVVNASSPTEVLDGDLFTKTQEKDYMTVVTNAPSALPRLAGRYDPNRIYSPTSPTSDLKEDFRSYYRARGSFQSGSNGSSGSSSADSGTPLFGGRSPLYGGAVPYYGPLIQQQSPAAFPQGNFNLPAYAPQFIPPYMNQRDYYQQPAFRPSTPTSDQSES